MASRSTAPSCPKLNPNLAIFLFARAPRCASRVSFVKQTVPVQKYRATRLQYIPESGKKTTRRTEIGRQSEGAGLQNWGGCGIANYTCDLPNLPLTITGRNPLATRSETQPSASLIWSTIGCRCSQRCRERTSTSKHCFFVLKLTTVP